MTYDLSQNYPNPFNPSTTITYSIPGPGEIKLIVLDALGREVATLVNGYKPAGIHDVAFNGENIPSGMYYYRLITDGTTITRKMTLLR